MLTVPAISNSVSPDVTHGHMAMLTANGSATVNFTLVNDAPLRLQEGGGSIHAVPSGLTGISRTYYLPLILH